MSEHEVPLSPYELQEAKERARASCVNCLSSRVCDIGETDTNLRMGTELDVLINELIERASMGCEDSMYWVGHFANWWSTSALDDAEANLPSIYRVC